MGSVTTNHRQLRPSHSDDGRNSAFQETLPNKKKRVRLTKVACDFCRAKKTACDGVRPTCTSCLQRNSECIFVSVDENETPTQVLQRENAELREKYDALKNIFDCLRCGPLDASRVLLQQLRTSVDPMNVLNHGGRSFAFMDGYPAGLERLNQADFDVNGTRRHDSAAFGLQRLTSVDHVDAVLANQSQSDGDTRFHHE